MADVIRLEKGFSPWRPASDAVLVKEYAYHEIPLRGVVEQHGVRYYFGCAYGSDEPVSVWFYVRLGPGDEAVLDAASAEEFDKAVTFGGPAMLALALEGPGIVATYLMESLSQEEITHGYRSLVMELQDLAERAKELIPG